MRQVLFEIPWLGLKVHGFSVMLVAAAAAGVYLTAWRARREKIHPDVVWSNPYCSCSFGPTMFHA